MQRTPPIFHGTPWNRRVRTVLHRGAHESIHIPRDKVPHPKEVGFRRSLGTWRGQRADYRFGLPDGRGLHVRVFRDHYDLHWDRVNPHRNPLAHWWKDSPKELAAVLVLAVAAAVAMTR